MKHKQSHFRLLATGPLAFLVACGESLMPGAADAQQMAPECRFDPTATSTIPNSLVERDILALTFDGTWTSDTPESRYNAWRNGVSYHIYSGAPLQININRDSAQLHFDLDVGTAGAGRVNGAGFTSGWCNTEIRNATPFSGVDRAALTIDTLDSYTVFNDQVALGSQDLYTPVGNTARHWQLNSLTIVDTDVTLDGLNLAFFDPRQGGQGSEATLTFAGGSLDASASPLFGTVASAGDPVPLRITSLATPADWATPGEITVNRLQFAGTGGQLNSSGPTYVDVLDGTTFEIAETGAYGLDSERVFRFPATSRIASGDLVNTAWTFDVGRDGNGGVLAFHNSNVAFDAGTVILHDDTRFEVIADGANPGRSAIGTLRIDGNNATHFIGRSDWSQIGQIDVNADNFLIDVGLGGLQSTLNMARNADDTTVRDDFANEFHSSLNVFLIGSDDASDRQTLTFGSIGSSANPDRFRVSASLFDNTEILIEHASVVFDQFLARSDEHALVLGQGAVAYFQGNPDPLASSVHVRIETTGDSAASVVLRDPTDLSAHYTFEPVADAPFALVLGDETNTTSFFGARGDLRIPGTNTSVYVGFGSTLSPGDGCFRQNCTSDGFTAGFGDFETLGNIDFASLSRVVFDLGLESGVATSDTLRYGDNVQGRISALRPEFSAATGTPVELNLRPLGFSDAREIAGQSFVLIERTAGTNGDLRSDRGTQLERWITTDPSMPASLRFFLIEEPSTTGRLVIGAETDLQQLTRQTNDRNHRNLVGSLVTQVDLGGTQTLSNGTTLSTALHTLTAVQNAQLSGAHAEPFSSYQTVSLEDHDLVSGIVLANASRAGLSFNGISTARSGQTNGSDASPDPRHHVWGSFAYTAGTVMGDDDLGSFGYNIGGLVMGTDLHEDASSRAGLFAAFNRTTLDEHDLVQQDLSGNTFHIGAYGNWKNRQGLSVSALFGLSFGQHESERSAPDIGAFTGGTATAKFNTYGVYAGFAAEREFRFQNGWSLTPALSTVYTRTDQSGTQEAGGGDFNYTLSAGKAEGLTTNIGMTAVKTLGATDQDLTLIGSLHYRHDWLADADSTHEITASIPILGSFTQVGQNRGGPKHDRWLGHCGTSRRKHRVRCRIFLQPEPKRK